MGAEIRRAHTAPSPVVLLCTSGLPDLLKARSGWRRARNPEPSAPGLRESRGETVEETQFIDETHALVPSSRIVLVGKTFATRNVGSPGMHEVKPNGVLPILLLPMGAAFVIVGGAWIYLAKSRFQIKHPWDRINASHPRQEPARSKASRVFLCLELSHGKAQRRQVCGCRGHDGLAPTSPANHRKMLTWFLHTSLNRTKRKPRSALPSASTGMPAARKAAISALVPKSNGSFTVMVALWMVGLDIAWPALCFFWRLS